MTLKFNPLSPSWNSGASFVTAIVCVSSLISQRQSNWNAITFFKVPYELEIFEHRIPEDDENKEFNPFLSVASSLALDLRSELSLQCPISPSPAMESSVAVSGRSHERLHTASTLQLITIPRRMNPSSENHDHNVHSGYNREEARSVAAARRRKKLLPRDKDQWVSLIVKSYGFSVREYANTLIFFLFPATFALAVTRFQRRYQKYLNMYSLMVGILLMTMNMLVLFGVRNRTRFQRFLIY
jgi:hypothetical protein